MGINVQSQDLSKHQWKHRLLLVITKDTLAPDYQKQMESLRSDPEGLEERRLFIYKLMPSEYQEGITSGKWIHSPELYKSFHERGNTFEVVLIGLDGREKHRSETLVPLKQIYSWIDVMPMRREEQRRNQEKGNKY